MTNSRRSRNVRACAHHERKSLLLNHKMEESSSGSDGPMGPRTLPNSPDLQELHPIYVASGNEHAQLQTVYDWMPAVGGMDAYINDLNRSAEPKPLTGNRPCPLLGLIRFDDEAPRKSTGRSKNYRRRRPH